MLTIIVLTLLTVTLVTFSIQFVCYLQYMKASPFTTVQPAAKDYSLVYA